MDWPTALTTLECERGSTRRQGTPSTQPGADQPTTALRHLETTVIAILAAAGARAVSTVSPAFRRGQPPSQEPLAAHPEPHMARQHHDT